MLLPLSSKAHAASPLPPRRAGPPECAGHPNGGRSAPPEAGKCAVPSSVRQVIEALDFAAVKHRDQRRKDVGASPYINHPIALARVLAVEAGIEEAAVLCAALLHDTIEDTQTTEAELRDRFGEPMCALVLELTDDKALPKGERKRLQVDRAPTLSPKAKLVKLADKICNLRDMADNPPADWSLERRREYFEWARSVVDGLRGTHGTLERIFDQAYARKP